MAKRVVGPGKKKAAKRVARQRPIKPTPLAAAKLRKPKSAAEWNTTTPVEIQFRWPSPTAATSTLFPPTLHTDARYAAGIGLPHAAAVAPNDVCRATLRNYYNHQHEHRSPVLSQSLAELWTHKFAATSAVHTQFPASLYRCIGTITRTAVASSTRTAAAMKARATTLPAALPATAAGALRNIPPPAARKRADAEVRAGTLPAHLARARAAAIHRAWQAALRPPLLAAPTTRPPPAAAAWDTRGDLLRSTVGADPRYVTVQELLVWLLSTTTTITPNDDNDRDGRDELVSILRACQDLSDPSHLWKIPLLLVYPVVTFADAAPPPTKTSGRKKAKLHAAATEARYTIQMAVYMHRLLPEATTASLGTILRALDGDSYLVTVPRIVPAAAGTAPTFCQSPYPIVCLDDGDLAKNNDGIRRNSSKENYRTQTNDSETPLGAVHDDDTPDGDKKPAAAAQSVAERRGLDRDTNDDDGDDAVRVSAYTTRGLLKLLEHCGTDLSAYHATIAPRLHPSVFFLPLLLHQQHALAWMVQQEHLPGFGLNSLFWEERQFLDGTGSADCSTSPNSDLVPPHSSDVYYVSIALGQVRLERPDTIKGGLLCDEMGLGKTIEVLGLIYATLPELKSEAKRDGRNHSTLIIVPPALVSQWQAEIVKCTGDGLVVDYLDHQSGQLTRRGSATGDADIVLTTYKALERPAAARLLNEQRWGRLVLDEMQEIRSTTTKVAKTCEKLDCNRRWMISGTPLFDGIDDLRGELNFLRLVPFSADSEDGFFKFMISEPWEDHNPRAIVTLQTLSAVMLRRSKSMTIKATGVPILGLLPLTVEFVPIQQTNSERAIYYYLESVVARVLMSSSDSSERVNASRRLCLRLLRDVCNSAILLNGGLGASSQLKPLNQLLIAEARRAKTRDKNEMVGNTSMGELRARVPVMSCDEAVLYLAQVQEATRTGDDEVATLSLGFGQGLSKRARAAASSADEKLAKAAASLQKASAANKEAKSQRAKARWHLALEKLTMGELPHYLSELASPKFRCLWAWRSAVATFPNCTLPKFPMFLLRGWRPSSSLAADWHHIHPEFYWSHPHSCLLESIPTGVKAPEIAGAIAAALVEAGTVESLQAARQRFYLIELRKSLRVWNAGVQFARKEDADAIFYRTTKLNGISVATVFNLPEVEDSIVACKYAYDEALVACNVFPNDNNRSNKKIAKQALSSAMLGLRILQVSKANGDVGGVVRLSPSHAPYRNETPRRWHLLYASANSTIDMCSSIVTATASTMSTEERKMCRLREVAQKVVAGGVECTSAFQSLQALSEGLPEKTSCCICLDYLGSADEDSGSTATISMTVCGHVYCRSCLKECMVNPIKNPCPSCRRDFHPLHDVVHIDPKKSVDRAAFVSRSEAAKTIVREASRMLEESHGLLEPEMWDQLYLAIDAPDGCDDRLDSRVSALPRHFLAHLRSCIQGLPLHGSPSDKPLSLAGEHSCLSSKVKALLRDLPRDERSVILSASKATIQHLESVLEIIGVGCRSLFTGQKVACSEQAVTDWQSSQPGGALHCPVLLVQAGAAASGLTLTAASRMFLMEPLLRASEEQQAYGRCHRYGQTKGVHVTCYYAPVSVESRLLEWRKRAAHRGATKERAAPTQETNIIYSTMDSDDDDDDDDEEEASMAAVGDDVNGGRPKGAEGAGRTTFSAWCPPPARGWVSAHGDVIDDDAADAVVLSQLVAQRFKFFPG